MFSYPLDGKAHVYVSGHDLSEFSAKLERNYTVSGCGVENHWNQGPSRGSILLLRQNFSPLSIRLPLHFYAGSKRETMAQLSRFNALCKGTVTLDLGDGFFYRCILTEIGETAWLGDDFCAVDYTFSGIRCGEKTTLEGAAPLQLYNRATFSKSDCVITLKDFKLKSSVPVTVTVSDGKTTFLTWKLDTAGGLYQAGGDLVLDGVNKRNLYGGGNIPTGTLDFFDYPYLKPGTNTVSVSGGLSAADIRIDYVPAYL